MKLIMATDPFGFEPSSGCRQGLLIGGISREAAESPLSREVGEQLPQEGTS